MIVSGTNALLRRIRTLNGASENVKMMVAAAEGGTQVDELRGKPLGLFDPAICLHLSFDLAFRARPAGPAAALTPAQTKTSVFSIYGGGVGVYHLRSHQRAIKGWRLAECPRFDVVRRPFQGLLPTCPNNSCVSQPIWTIRWRRTLPRQPHERRLWKKTTNKCAEILDFVSRFIPTSTRGRFGPLIATDTWAAAILFIYFIIPSLKRLKRCWCEISQRLFSSFVILFLPGISPCDSLCQARW